MFKINRVLFQIYIYTSRILNKKKNLIYVYWHYKRGEGNQVIGWKQVFAYNKQIATQEERIGIHTGTGTYRHR